VHLPRQAIIDQLLRDAKQEDPSESDDWEGASYWFGSNGDDIWEAGVSAGERLNARLVLDAMGIPYDE
jgi:hypothetical protein